MGLSKSLINTMLSRRSFLKLSIPLIFNLLKFPLSTSLDTGAKDITSSTEVLFPLIGNRSEPQPFIKNYYAINILEDNELPYAKSSPLPLDYEYPHDENGVLIFVYKENTYYHPVAIAQLTLMFLESYRLSGNLEYWDKADIHLNKLLDISVKSDNARYFPYGFDFALHGIPEDTLIAPWYSGMAQGQALSAFVRAYKLRGVTEYLTASEEIFRSFTQYLGNSNPWTVFIDDRGYYWIEEYPYIERTQALNGFIFGIYGLYDYYIILKDLLAFELCQAAITTVQEYIYTYRVPGGISYYCQRHKQQIPKYHIIHTQQLFMLYKITQADFFRTAAEAFYSDYH